MKKGRKWDDQTPRVRPKCLEAAREVAKKINSRLIAEGFLKLPEENSARSAAEVHNMNDPAAQALPTLGGSRGLLVGTTLHDQQCTVEIDINEIPLACRNLLTRSVTQEDISKMSGAKVSTKGRFMTSTEKMMSKLTGEKALHLCVQGAVASSVELAVQRITSIISSTCNIPPTSLSIMSQNMPLSTTSKPLLMPGPPSSLNFTPQTLAFVQDKLFIGLEQAPPTFDIKTKLLGPNGTYLHHIQSETGAKVLLRGRGSGFNEPTSGREAFEPMHIYIQHSNHVGLNQARTLAQNLLQTVQHEYATFQQQLAFMPPSVLPATASMLAGLQQQQQNFTAQQQINLMLPVCNSSSTTTTSLIMPINTTNNNTSSSCSVMYPQQTSMLPTMYPSPTSLPTMNHHASMLSSLPPIPYSFPIDNFIPKPMGPTKRPPLLQSSPILPLYGSNSSMHQQQQQQISSFSAVQNYYKNYIQTANDILYSGPQASPVSNASLSNSSEASSSDASTTNNNDEKNDDDTKKDDGSSHAVTASANRRRFQEKIEDLPAVKKTAKDSATVKKSKEEKIIMPPPFPPTPTTTSSDSKLQSIKSTSNSSKNAVDKEIMPPPMMTNLKTLSSKRLKSSASDGKSSKDANSSKGNTKISFSLADSPAVKPKKLEGALGGIVAYGSDSEEDSET